MIYEIEMRDLWFLISVVDGMLVCSNFIDYFVIVLDDFGDEI